jgi:hypothetical protein
MQTAERDIQACLSSLENMIDRAKKLGDEYDLRIRKADYKGPAPGDLVHAISFAEVQELDRYCKAALERHASEIPALADLAEHWYVHDSQGMDSPEELRTDLVRKRTTLSHALNLVREGTDASGPPADVDKTKDRDGRWPTLLGHISFIPRSLGVVADIGGGIAVLLAVAHWVFGVL